MDFQNELAVAKNAAIAAGKEILKVYNSKSDIEFACKEDNSPVTLADTASNTTILQILKKEFPEYGYLSEEELVTNRENKKLVWIIDPLDGTKDFLQKSGEFTVNIALIQDGKPVIGVIYLPVKDNLYFAREGDGAFLQTSKSTRKITVSNHNSSQTMSVVHSVNHVQQKTLDIISKHKFAKSRGAGSSLKGCLIATGEADVFFCHGKRSLWDIAAMDCILQQAGGILTTLDGNKVSYDRAEILIDKFVASNNTIHQQLIEM